MIWINGENFRSAKENNMLFGPFTEKLPNFNDYVDATNEDVTLDFAYPIEGYEAPYGKAQFVMMADTDKTPEASCKCRRIQGICRKISGESNLSCTSGLHRQCICKKYDTTYRCSGSYEF